MASLSDAAGGIAAQSKEDIEKILDTPESVATLFRFMDAVCVYFGSRSKPATWLGPCMALVLDWSGPGSRAQAVVALREEPCRSRGFEATLALWPDAVNGRLLKSLLEAPEASAAGGEDGGRRKRTRTGGRL